MLAIGLENAEYYDYLATVVVDARIAEQVIVENWKRVTNKIILCQRLKQNRVFPTNNFGGGY